MLQNEARQSCSFSAKLPGYLTGCNQKTKNICPVTGISSFFFDDSIEAVVTRKFCLQDNFYCSSNSVLFSQRVQQAERWPIPK